MRKSSYTQQYIYFVHSCSGAKTSNLDTCYTAVKNTTGRFTRLHEIIINRQAGHKPRILYLLMLSVAHDYIVSDDTTIQK